MSLLLYTPVYKIEFWSGSTKRHGFGYSYNNTELISFRIKPGLTKAIGSFEIVIADTGSNASGITTGNAFKNIEVFDTVKMWFGYTGSGLTPPTAEMFTGRIDTKEISYSESGCYRTFTGRDLGEPLERILQRRAYTGSLYDSAVSLKDAAGLSSANTFISGSSDLYAFVQDNTSCFDSLIEISDFDNKDCYTGTGSDFHWFPRQSYLDSTTTFVEGVDIFSYNYVKDIAGIKNDYYVFGVRDISPISGSDIPKDHDGATESTTSGWTAVGRSGSGIWKTLPSGVGLSPDAATGSNSIRASIGYTGTGTINFDMMLSYTLPQTLYLSSNDFLHVFFGTSHGTFSSGTELAPVILLYSNAPNDFFECKIEQQSMGWNNKLEFNIPLGPVAEGISSTGSLNSSTGSYKWTRHGNPDWFNINYFAVSGSISGTWSDANPGFQFNVDGLYFGVPFQYHTSGSDSINAYGLRTEIINDSRINSNLYAKNTGDIQLEVNQNPTTQIDIKTITRPYVIGTRYPITINSENINSNFELIDLEHNWSNNTLTSKCLFTDQAQKRIPVPIINYPVQAVEDRISLLQKMASLMGGLPILANR